MKDIIKAIPDERITLYALILIIVLTGIIRIGLLGVPIERDEGEYAYAGQLILQGIPPYQEVFNMKFPGTYALYAFFMAIFGQTHQSLHLALLIINVITIVLVFLLAKQIANRLCGVISAAGFALLSMSESVEGIYTYAEHFVIVFAVGGLLLMLKGLATQKKYKLFIAGLLLGLGFVMKQHGIAFVALAVLYILYDSLRRRPVQWRELIIRSFSLAGGVLTVVAVLCIIMIWTGVFRSFLFWTIDYASRYVSQKPINQAWPIFKYFFMPILSSAPLLWILVGMGFFALLAKNIHVHHRVFLIMFAIFSFLSICPGFYFRPHYFILLLPCTALFIGLAISAFADYLSRLFSRNIQYGVPILLILICLSQSIYIQRDYLFRMNYFEISRSMYWLCPFYESLKIAEFLKEHTVPEDRIAIFGSEPQIFFYSQRRSASPYIYMYPLMEDHDFALNMQRDFIKDVESSNPKYMLYVNVPNSWAMTSDSHKEIFQWLDSHLLEGHLRLVGLVELFEEKSLYYWEQDVKWPASSECWVAIFERIA